MAMKSVNAGVDMEMVSYTFCEVMAVFSEKGSVAKALSMRLFVIFCVSSIV